MKNKIFLIVIIFIGLVSNIFPQQTFRKAVLLSRSVGNHIWQHEGATTDVPTEVTAYNNAHSYTGENAVTFTKVYPFPTLTSNEWYGWHGVFDKVNGFDDIYTDYLDDTTYNIIVIKTCFFSSDMYGGLGSPNDTTGYTMTRSLYNYKWEWRSIIRIMESYPNKFFVLWTLAPNVEGETSYQQAFYANWFSAWAKDTLATGLDATYGAFPPNVYVFDYFHLIDSSYYEPLSLADAVNDAHPNAHASELAAPIFVQEVFDAAINYESTIPVELISFTASIVPSGVELNWSTATELNNDKFEIQKKINNGDFIAIDFVKGHGTSTQKNGYSFLDKITNSGKYQYRLKQIDFDGNYEYSKVVEVDFNPITTYTLEQNYPNPFNPSTEINFTLAKSGSTTLKVYNISGSEVATLIDGFMESGKHSVKFNAKDSTSGIYFYRIKADNFTATRKMLLIK